MNCQEIVEILDNHDVNRLGAAERLQIEAHLVACPECARDWELHGRFNAMPDAAVPSGFQARCRALVAAGSRTGNTRRAGSRYFLISSFAAVAAAAAMLAVYLANQPAVPAVTNPVSVAVSAASAQAAAAPTPASIEQPSDSTREEAVEQPTAQVPAAAPFAVRVEPLKNEATDSASAAAIDALFAALLKELQSIPGVILTIADPSGGQSFEPQPEVSDWYVLELAGMGPVSGNLFRSSLQAHRLGADGKSRITTSYSIRGDIASSCTGAAIPDLSVCNSPVGVAAYLVQFLRTTVFPPDLSFRRELQAQLLDRGLTPRQRLAALSNLRSFGMGHSSAGPEDVAALRDPVTVRGAVDLAAETTDPAQRAQIWRTFRGAGFAELLAPLVAASQLDPDPQVRVEAVGTLAADFKDDARTRAAFEVLARDDTSPLVRALARRNLSGEASWKEYIVASLKDSSRPAAERLEAFLFHINAPTPLTTGPHVTDPRNVLQELLNDETIPVLAEVLPQARDSSIGSAAWVTLVSRLGSIDHPAITDMLLESIGNAADGSVKHIVLSQLRLRVSEARVRTALEKVAAEAADPELRMAAQAALEASPVGTTTTP